MVHNTIQDNEKIKKLEQIHMTRVSHTDSALSFHLMPPSGWLNDPNGLCQLHGTYHIFSSILLTPPLARETNTGDTMKQKIL